LSNRYYNLNDIREHVSSGKLAPDVRRGEERKFIGNVHIHVDGKNYHVSSLDDAGFCVQSLVKKHPMFGTLL